MKIAIIGKGNVGSALERGLSRGGHEVRSVGKEPAKVREIARDAEAVVLAVPFGALDDVVKEAKSAVMDMARSIGFDPVDAGPLDSARLLEPMAYQNIVLGYGLGMGTDIGFKLVH